VILFPDDGHSSVQTEQLQVGENSASSQTVPDASSQRPVAQVQPTWPEPAQNSTSERVQPLPAHNNCSQWRSCRFQNPTSNGSAEVSLIDFSIIHTHYFIHIVNYSMMQ
jgi:hypothetical protein